MSGEAGRQSKDRRNSFRVVVSRLGPECGHPKAKILANDHIVFTAAREHKKIYIYFRLFIVWIYPHYRSILDVIAANLGQGSLEKEVLNLNGISPDSIEVK